MTINTKALLALVEIVTAIHDEYGPDIERIKKEKSFIEACRMENHVDDLMNHRFDELVKNRSDMKLSTIRMRDADQKVYIGNDVLTILHDTNTMGLAMGDHVYDGNPATTFERFLYIVKNDYSFIID